MVTKLRRICSLGLFSIVLVQWGPHGAADIAGALGAPGLSVRLDSIGTAQAAGGRVAKFGPRLKKKVAEAGRTAIVVQGAGQATVIKAELTSEAGGESVTLVQSGAKLHGAAARDQSVTQVRATQRRRRMYVRGST